MNEALNLQFSFNVFLFIVSEKNPFHILMCLMNSAEGKTN